jgi:hypothetical protein
LVCDACYRAILERPGAGDTPDAVALRMADEMIDIGTMDISLAPITVFQLTGLIQLAMRDPFLPQPAQEAGNRFLAAVREYFADCPTVLDVVRRGDNPAEDMPLDEDG